MIRKAENFGFPSIILAGAATLYVELAVIRYIPGQIRVLGYFTNFVLFAAFFGYGLGMLSSRRWQKDWIACLAPIALFGIACLVEIGTLLNVIPSTTEHFLFLEYQSTRTAISLFSFLSVSFILLSLSFLPLGYFVGQTLKGDKPLRRYLFNIIGSLLGITIFVVVAALSTSPWIWMLLAGIMSSVMLPRAEKRWQIIGGFSVLFLTLIVGYATRDSIWSPYHKITLGPAYVLPDGLVHEWQLPFLTKEGRDKLGYLLKKDGFTVRVNDDSYQTVLNLTDAAINRHPQLKNIRLQFDLPFILKKKFSGNLKNNQKKELIGDVLILGAGTGNDVAAALRAGAGKVDAVEIDPKILQLGREMHPEHPYQDPRVKIYIDDARSFLFKNKYKYDMIIFGLLDSHILASQKSNIRLDSFVFTRESFDLAKKSLRQDGILVLSHAVGAEFFSERIRATLLSVFGKEPIIAQDLLFHPIGITYVTGEQVPPGRPLKPDTNITILQDDWPFVYLEGRKIPRDYFRVMLLIAIITIVGVRIIAGRTWQGADFHFFALGGGFLLIETRAIAVFMAIVGTTWLVNSAIFAGILVMALFAAIWVAKFEKRGDFKISWIYYGLLMVFLALNYIIPIGNLSGLPLFPRILIGAVFLSLPLFASGVIFATSLSKIGQADRALASNLIGALIGGLVEYLSMVTGFRYLIIPAALFYLLAFLFSFRTR